MHILFISTIYFAYKFVVFQFVVSSLCAHIEPLFFSKKLASFVYVFLISSFLRKLLGICFFPSPKRFREDPILRKDL